MTPSNDCYELIKHFEGLYLEAYVCPAGVLTVGYGCTTNVQKGMKISKAEADIRLINDVAAFAERVNGMVTVDLKQHQFDSLVSFAFNVGADALRRSTLLRKLNAKDYEGAAQEYKRWNKAGGNVLPGLIKRRYAEEKLFRGESWQI